MGWLAKLTTEQWRAIDRDSGLPPAGTEPTPGRLHPSLVVLAVMCTVVPQVLVLHVLRALSPFTVAVSTNLEPVYALVVAAIVFPDAEALPATFYAGTALLLGLVALNAVRRRPRG